ncbi:arginase family protein [Agromyces sp. NPDC058110]|uniref:arginase family protein n=1 Tax=Agromyces sp. NPDC058110 TaxID=3346345 RepID=UPI0036DF26C9
MLKTHPVVARESPAIALLAAPSNLGLRPPSPGSVPGTAKAPEALREAGLHARFLRSGATDAGVVLPGRYRDDADAAARRVRNHDALIDHSLRLADRVGALLDAGAAPLVLGGDCSILVGTGLALRRRGRFGLVHLDGHTDFRHPGNSDACASVAGEDLAAAIGLHWPAISDLEGRAPYFAARDTVHIGCRDDDEHTDEARGLLADLVPAGDVRRDAAAAIERTTRVVHDHALDGYWLHLDVDVLDPAFMPAVDSPDPGGLAPDALVALLTALAPRAAGAQVTVFDPDLDPDGRHARLLADVLAAGLRDLGWDA